MTWTRITIDSEGHPVTVYINGDDTRAIGFPMFGKYFSLSSDKSALDMATSFIFNHSPNKELSFTQYINSQEDTGIIYQEVA